MDHGHGSNQNDRRNYLVRVKAGMEKTHVMRRVSLYKVW
jgi:hypothetical protein